MAAKKNVMCKVCGEYFDRNAEVCLFIPTSRRYAHLACAEAANLKGEIIYPPPQPPRKNINNDKSNDLIALEQYIIKLFNLNYITPRIRKQINQYHKDYNFSYNGMLKTLIYWFEIKQEPVENANEGIGIIPYIFLEAKDYYYHLFSAQQSNKEKNLELKERTIEIQPPRPREKKIKLFFEEEANEDLNE